MVEDDPETRELHQRLGTTIVYVTHDQIEAMTLADRIAVMRDGHVLQLGTPDEVYNDPVDMFVAGFMGSPCASTWGEPCSSTVRARGAWHEALPASRALSAP